MKATTFNVKIRFLFNRDKLNGFDYELLNIQPILRFISPEFILH